MRFKGLKEYLTLDPVNNGKPLELIQNRSYVMG